MRFAVTVLTRLCPPSSARFPWINYRSRSLSPPVELSSCRTLQDATLKDQAGFRIPGERKMPDGSPAKRAPSGIPRGDETPPWALAVAEVRPRGSTGRVGAGLHARTSPEMRSGSHHGD